MQQDRRRTTRRLALRRYWQSLALKAISAEVHGVSPLVQTAQRHCILPCRTQQHSVWLLAVSPQYPAFSFDRVDDGLLALTCKANLGGNAATVSAQAGVASLGVPTGGKSVRAASYRSCRSGLEHLQIRRADANESSRPDGFAASVAGRAGRPPVRPRRQQIAFPARRGQADAELHARSGPLSDGGRRVRGMKLLKMVVMRAALPCRTFLGGDYWHEVCRCATRFRIWAPEMQQFEHHRLRWPTPGGGRTPVWRKCDGGGHNAVADTGSVGDQYAFTLSAQTG